nr:hypothetical protein [Micromonospora sp. DSM 115978]
MFLLVVCPTPEVAAWCAEPVVVSEPGLVLTPVVLGPEQVPLVDDPAVARRSPEAAVLSAIAHGGRFEPDVDRTSLFDALLAGLDTLDQDHAALYTDIVLTVLPQAARDYLEGLI